jgi:hypothetical protein
MKNDNKEPLSAEENEKLNELSYKYVKQRHPNIKGQIRHKLAHAYREGAAAELESLKKEREWIPVSERLPEHYGSVLGKTNLGFYRVTWKDRSTKEFDVMELNEDCGEHYICWIELNSLNALPNQ